ncbi:MAG: ATP-binding protein [Clostridia bacterium]|nr:ATP-binding protein [Clostridia bacterium]
MDNANTITIALSGRIDSNNAQDRENEILAQLAGKGNVSVVLDAEKLEYISSAGLRAVLRLKKAYPELKITNVSSEVYEILEMTGFTEMMTVEKAYRVVSVEGCEVIGEGANGKVYRIDGDNVVKTYKNADALAEIQHEREVARLALILGVPTAISYDIVRVGDSYGSVFELLNASSFAKILATQPERFDWCVKEYVGMLKKIHGISVPEGKLPHIKNKFLQAVGRLRDTLPDGLGDKLLKMTEELPDPDRMIHGDYHTKNIVLAGDEVLIIDMDTLSVGHPIFDLIPMYNAYYGFSEYDHDIVLKFQGFNQEIANRFWHDSLAGYIGTKDEKKIAEVENKVRCLSYAYLIDRSIRHGLTDDPATAIWKSRLLEVLTKVDSLDFEASTDTGDPNEIELDATVDNLQKVLDFVGSRLGAFTVSPKAQMQTDIAVEEIFVNIAHYAYGRNEGKAKVRVEVSGDPPTAYITFTDRGIPYDPLKKEDPDVTLSAEERKIGGLGIFMTKKIMDGVSYEYKNGQNVLTLKKIL